MRAISKNEAFGWYTEKSSPALFLVYRPAETKERKANYEKADNRI